MIIAASSGFDRMPMEEPIPRKTNPTSPRGIIPTPIAKRLSLVLPNTLKPVTILPRMATTMRKIAIANPSRLLGMSGFKTPKSVFAPTVTKKIGTSMSAIGTTCFCNSLRVSVSSKTKPAAKAPRIASNWIVAAK